MTSLPSDGWALSVLRMRIIAKSLDAVIAVGEAVLYGTYCQNADLESTISHTRHGKYDLCDESDASFIYVVSIRTNKGVV